MPVTIKSTGGGSVTVQAASTASDYTVNLPAASGDIAVTVSGAVPASQGGTGQTSLTANNVLLGNGTSAVQFVAPGSNGNVLTSNGTAWTSTAPVATASLTLLATLNMTSGTTQSATGLGTTYPSLLVVVNGLTPSVAATYTIEASSTNGSAYGTAVSLTVSGTTNALYGAFMIFQANSSVSNHPLIKSTNTVYLFNDSYVATDTSSAINALRFSLSAGTFSAGTILIYGWK